MDKINLQKGSVINLRKANSDQELRKLHVGLGWDVHKNVSADLDAFIVALDGSNREVDTVYFGHKISRDGAIKHSGDNLTGEGEGDDEVIFVNLNELNPSIMKLVVAVNIYGSRVTFEKVENAFVRLLNQENEKELIRYDLSNNFGNNYSMILGEILRNEDGTWSFKAVGEGTKDGSVKEVAKRVQNPNYVDIHAPSPGATPPVDKKKKLFGLF